MKSRRAVTLIEVLVAIGIVALLIGITIPAIQKVRESALRTKSTNNVRQIMLGMHNFAAAHGNTMPGRTSWADSNYQHIDENIPIYITIASYLEVNVDRSSFDPDKPETMLVPVYMDPGDPSWLANPTLTDTRTQGYCSYPINVWAFGGANRNAPAGYPDGMSHTIGIGGHYMRCGKGPRSQSIWDLAFGPPDSERRRATFADPWYKDVVPKNDPARGLTIPSVLGKTFQARPSLDECDPSVAQTPYRAGLIVGMMDGSSRTIRPSVAIGVFWAAVTKDGNEVIDLD